MPPSSPPLLLLPFPQDKNEKVRRRVMATLGELLFYIATTQQDVPGGGTVHEAAEMWGINAGIVSSVVRWEGRELRRG